ncbi:MAG: hypothetical protein COA55_03015 [Alcanivorax sp.]|nr:MAG: hypothetical protein COA55_03015 [Alcanivorax sp.]
MLLSLLAEKNLASSYELLAASYEAPVGVPFQGTNLAQQGNRPQGDQAYRTQQTSFMALRNP